MTNLHKNLALTCQYTSGTLKTGLTARKLAEYKLHLEGNQESAGKRAVLNQQTIIQFSMETEVPPKLLRRRRFHT
jgi:hypothetical protein